MEKLDRQFYEQIKLTGIPAPRDKILVCVSGGPDSVALLHLLLQTKKPFSFELGLAHVNHGLRGESSDRDQKFVEDLAIQYSLPIYVHRIRKEEWNNKPGTGVEEKGRIERISFFNRISKQHSYTRIALGHTQDDLLETLLFNLLRGTSPEGLCNLMPLFDPDTKFFRPLQIFTKHDLLSFLEHKKLPFCIDQTNFENQFTRNKIRNLLIPILKEINPQAGESLLRFQKVLLYDMDYLQTKVENFLQSPSVLEKEGEIKVSVSDFLALPLSLKLRLIRVIKEKLIGKKTDLYFSQINSIVTGIIDKEKFSYKDKLMSIDRIKDWIVFLRSGDLG